MKRIVWDWNGTLLDDIELCFQSINYILQSNGLRPLSSLNAYRGVFGFPIEQYYQNVGFDFSKKSFSLLAHEYMDQYQEKSYQCLLFDDVLPTLKKASHLGICQTILSASRKDYLMKQIHQYDILPYVDSVWGIEDIYAQSKVSLAQSFMKTCNFDDDVWFVGDTIHDHEVAKAVGAHCILVTTGHQSRQRLMETKRLVVNDLTTALEYIYGTD